MKHDGNSEELRRIHPDFDANAPVLWEDEAQEEGGDENSYTPPQPSESWFYILIACVRGHFHSVRGLVECGASLRIEHEKLGSVIHTLCDSPDIEQRIPIVAWLLAKACDVEIRGWLINYGNPKFGRTALHIAILRGSLEMVRLLIANGADRQCKCNMGATALQHAEKMWCITDNGAEKAKCDEIWQFLKDE